MLCQSKRASEIVTMLSSLCHTLNTTDFRLNLHDGAFHFFCNVMGENL